MRTSVGGQVGGHVVVALGEVSPDLVTGHLPPRARFVAAPRPQDLQDAVGAIVRADALVDAAMLDRMPHLRVLARTGVGVERVDVAEATRRGIAVVVMPGAGTQAVAEGTLAMILHLVKRLRATTDRVAQGRWSQRGSLSPGDLEGATLGIVGHGRIGRRVDPLARAFDMTVLARDPFLTEAGSAVGAAGVASADSAAEAELVGVDELRARSNVVTLHLPLTQQTHAHPPDPVRQNSRDRR